MAKQVQNRNTVQKTLTLSPLAAGALAALEDLGAGSGAGAVVERLLQDEVTGRLRGVWEAGAAQVLRERAGGADPGETAEAVRRCIVGLLVGRDAGDQPHVSATSSPSAAEVDFERTRARIDATLAGADLPGCSHKGPTQASAAEVPLVQVRPPRSAGPDAMADLVRRAQGARDAIPDGRGAILPIDPPKREPATLEEGLRRSVDAAEQGVLLCGPCAAKVKAAGASGKAKLCRPCLERVLALATPAERAAIRAVVHHPKRETVEHGVDTPRAHRVEDLPADERRKVERAIGKA